MLPSQTAPPEVERDLAAALEADKGSYWTKEITGLFHWSKMHRFFWATTRKRLNAVVALELGGRVYLLTSPRGWRTLSAILLAEKKSLPADLSALEVAEAVRKLTVGPPGLIGSPQLLQRKSPPLHAWFKNDSDDDKAAFRSFCVDPRLERDAHTNEWNIAFFYFNDRGGVEHWFVIGGNAGLRDVTMKHAKPDETFNWPFE